MLNAADLGSVPCGDPPRPGRPEPTGVTAGRMVAIMLSLSPRPPGGDGTTLVLIGAPATFGDGRVPGPVGGGD